MIDMDTIENFKQAIRTTGIEPPGSIIPDGKLHRFTVPGDKSRSENGWYVFHADEPSAAAFGCWKRGISETWCSKEPSTMTAQENADYSAKLDAMKRQREADRQAVQAECRKKSAELWNLAHDVDADHPYIKAKQIKPYRVRQLKENLLVPVRDSAGNLNGLQFIGPDGTKKFKTGTAVAGCYLSIGKPNGKVLIVEGYATGATLHEVTGYAVAVAFNSGNLKPVAEALQAKLPGTTLIVCADDDHDTKGNPGLTKGTEAARAINGLLTTPIFPENRGPKDTDFNDLARLAGPEAVRGCLDQVVNLRQENDLEPVTPGKQLPFAYRCMSDIQSKPIRWLWPGRIARGKVSMLAGHPGLGKSQLTASMAAIVTTGGKWPVDRTPCSHGNVIFFSAEDDAEDTIRPRLEAAGANLDRVFILDAVLDEVGNRPRAFNLTTDLPRLGEMLSHIGDVALVVIDPITAYLGGTDSHKNADIRALLSPLGELAAKHGSAVVCVSHLNKGGSGEALMRVTGSLAFVAAARAAFLIVRDKEDSHRRLFLPLKNNIGNDQNGLAFTVESRSLPGNIETSCVSWEAEAVTITADEAMAPQGDPEERSALDDAKEFLSSLLADGPISSKQIRVDAEGAGHSWQTIRRAQKSLGIEPRKDGMKGPWMWSLPPKMFNMPEDAHQNNVSNFVENEHLRSHGEGSIEDFDLSEDELLQVKFL